MLSGYSAKLVISFLLGGVAVLASLSACGSPASEIASSPTAVDPTAALAATLTPVPTATSTATPAATSPSGSSGADSQGEDDLLEQGAEIFNVTAGGVGCAYCHGADGKGDGPAMVGAPANRGASEQMVRNALANVSAMSNINLTNQEIKAVVAYLQYLDEQP